jgi:lysozyme
MATTRKSPSSQCFSLIKSFEGICDGDPKTVNLDPYLDPVVIWSIGWGHAIRLNGRFLKGAADAALAKSLFPSGITFAEAEALLAEDVAPVAIYLNAVFPWLTQNQFDALISFVFNIGIGKFENSTLFKKLKAGDIAGAAAEFGRWIHGTDKRGNKIVLPGLVKRQEAQCALFLTPEVPNVHP